MEFPMMDILENQTAKEQEIIASLAEQLAISLSEAQELFNDLKKLELIQITPPAESPRAWGLVGMNRQGNGVSFKPGNILINMDDMLIAAGSTTATLAGVNDGNWTVIIACIFTAFISVMKAMKVTIDKKDVYVLKILWEHCDKEKKISVDDGFLGVNLALAKEKRNKMDDEAFHDSLNHLKGINALSVADGVITLEEKIKAEYQ